MKRACGVGCAVICAGMALNAADSFRRLDVADYRDRMEAAWIGQCAGVCWGAPTEFRWRDAIIPEDKTPKWTPEMINGAFDQDDLYVEMTFLRTLEVHGLGVSARQAGIDFANTGYELWCANAEGRNNLRRGIAPPDCSNPVFHHRANDIDYQIESDFAGIVSPGCPQTVIALGEKFGRLMNYGDGVWAGQFTGGMYAEAFFTADRERIVEAGLACVPAESAYAETIRDVLALYRENPKDWQGAWRAIVDKHRFCPAYQRDSNGPIDVRINGAMVVLGLLFGNGDPDETIRIATRGGYDSDCNPSSAAGVLFTTMGRAKLPERFTAKLDRGRKFSHTDYDLPALLAASEKVTRAIVAAEGGRVERDAKGEYFLIPAKKPIPSPYCPSWAAEAPVGSRYTPEERAQIKIPCTEQRLNYGGEMKLVSEKVRGGTLYTCMGGKITLNGTSPRLRVRAYAEKDAPYALSAWVDGLLVAETEVRTAEPCWFTADLSRWNGSRRVQLMVVPLGPRETGLLQRGLYLLGN